MRVRKTDAGFTLTELLVTIVLLGVIIFPLGNAVIGLIRLTDSTNRRLNESHDVQLVAAYFVNDVQSVGTRDWSAYPYPLVRSVQQNVTATGGDFPCGTNALPTAFLRLAWDDPQSASATPAVVRVSYMVRTVGPERQLHRVSCVGNATVASDLVVAHNLDTAAPVVTFTGDPDTPTSISLTLAIKNPGSSGAALTMTFTGQRRQQ